MKNFFKENIALIAGIALPFLLVAFFYIAEEIARRAVPDPLYAVVFVRDYYGNSGSPYQIRVENGRIVAEVKPPEDNTNAQSWGKPELYVQEPGKRSARKIAINFDLSASGPVGSPDLDVLNAMGHISTDPTAPDGYGFDCNARYNGGLLGEVLSIRGQRDSCYALIKPPRRIPITTPDPLYSANFLGWIIPSP